MRKALVGLCLVALWGSFVVAGSLTIDDRDWDVQQPFLFLDQDLTWHHVTGAGDVRAGALIAVEYRNPGLIRSLVDLSLEAAVHKGVLERENGRILQPTTSEQLAAANAILRETVDSRIGSLLLEAHMKLGAQVLSELAYRTLYGGESDIVAQVQGLRKLNAQTASWYSEDAEPEYVNEKVFCEPCSEPTGSVFCLPSECIVDCADSGPNCQSEPPKDDEDQDDPTEEIEDALSGR